MFSLTPSSILHDLLPLVLPVTLFAIATSATPGPVNVVAAAAGTQFGWRRSMPWTIGASVGFFLQMLVIGLGPGLTLMQLPWLQHILQWAGSAFLLWMAWRMFHASPEKHALMATARPPGSWQGALAQWLNPKAWIVIAAGIASYTIHGALYNTSVWLMSVIFLLVCLPSIGAWALLGHGASRLLESPRAVQRFNRLMALALAASVATLWL